MVVVNPFKESVESSLAPFHEKVLAKFDEYGNSVCLEDAESGKTYSFAQVRQMAISVAHTLPEFGFGKGDVLAVYLENRPEYGPILLGVSAAGGAVSGVNPLYTSGELSRQLQDSRARFIWTKKALLPKVLQADDGNRIRNIFLWDGADGSDSRCVSMQQLFQRMDVTSFPAVHFDLKQDVVFLPYSSGTTGLPKGVMLTHSQMNYIFLHTPNTSWSCYRVRQPGECMVHILPFFHIAGFMGLNWAMTFGGRGIVLPRFDPQLYLKMVSKHRASYLMLVPSLLGFVAKHPDVAKFDLSSVKSIGFGSAPSGKELIQSVIKRLPQLEYIEQGYGLTESGGLATVTPRIPIAFYPMGSCGVPTPGTEIKVMTIEDGDKKELGPMEKGEIWLRSPAIMKGYINNDEATRATIDDDGWLHTGDIGYFDYFGHFYVVDRLKELIKYKGFQVAPAELEDLVLKHEAVQEVGVTGIPDPEHPDVGELPTAFVVLKKGWKGEVKLEDEIKRLVASQAASFKQLRGGVLFRSELPKGASGKLLRRRLQVAAKL